MAKLNNKGWLREQQSTRSVGEIAKELNVSSSNLCKIFHKHGIEIVNHSSSSLERNLQEYYSAKNIQFVTNTRSVIDPRELDLYFYDHKVAVEINGCYYHSEQFGKDSSYHKSKTLACNAHGIRLMQFWDYEVRDQFSVVTSIIDRALDATHRIDARHCNVAVNSATSSQFFNENSLAKISGNTSIGLEHNDCLVCGADLSLGDNYCEILSIAIANNLQVSNAIDVLVNYVVRRFNVTTILTEIDLRYNTAAEFLTAGFEVFEHKPPSYFLINSSGSITNDTTENSFKVWDCGSVKLCYNTL